jgi:hypothetical protein
VKSQNHKLKLKIHPNLERGENMKIILETKQSDFNAGETVTVRVLALNDSYRPVTIDRRLLIGPNIKTEPPMNPPHPVSVEPASVKEEQNRLILNPWCFYGRERSFQGLPQGAATFYAYILQKPSGSLFPEKPGDAAALLASAEPLSVSIR